MDTGWVLCTVGASVDRGQTDWTNPGNITANDGTTATSTWQTDYLYASGFGFGSLIPSGAVITGAAVWVDFTGGAFGQVYLTKNGTTALGGGSVSSGGSGTYDVPGYMWETTLSLAEVSASTFGFMFVGGESGTYAVDAIWAKVYYGPTYINAGTGATDAGGAWSYTCQASAAAGSVFIVQILQDGTTTGAITSVVGTNIESLGGTDNTWTAVAVEQAVGSGTAALQSIYIGRALSTSAPTISGANSTSEDLYIRSYQFDGVSTGTTLATVIENISNQAGTGVTASDCDVQWDGLDRLALNFVAVNDDNAIAQFSGQSGGTWTEVSEYAESSGTDGAIQLQYAASSGSLGAIGNGTASITDSDAWGVVGFALIGTTVVVTEDGVPRPPRVYPQLLAH